MRLPGPAQSGLVAFLLAKVQIKGNNNNYLLVACYRVASTYPRRGISRCKPWACPAQGIRTR